MVFTKNEQRLFKKYTVVLHFGSDVYKIKLGFVQVDTTSSQAVISCSAFPLLLSYYSVLCISVRP